MEKVKKIKVSFDREANTLDVWFDEPKKEFVCEETADEVILKKDKKGKVIGFEKINFLALNVWKKNQPVEVVVG
ncbi:MAG TPA: DUF2283 domain-containing protein [Elusimicrobia bacterium]|nr:DUF2283 domain-containing protein [Elusimicrobiota bacterium]